MVMLFGGTFDPVHTGHLNVMREAVDILQPEHIHVVLSARPNHRSQPVAETPHRLAMLNLAFSGESGVEVNPIEVVRPGPSYSIWTLREMYHRFPDSSMVLLVGADALNGITSWYHGWEILSLCHLVVLTRPGYPVRVPNSMRYCLTSDSEALRSRHNGKIFHLDSSEHDISASQVRSQLGLGDRQEVLSSGVLPVGVGSYIDENKLYAG
jgi:nicotinate-nucleotide adenylyltransferase